MKSLNITDVAVMAAFAALIIVLGGIAVPIGGLGVPIVLQNMGIILAALLLGSLRGGLATALFLAVGLVGVPNLAGFKPTITALSGPTVGYLVGYLIAAFVIGAIAQRAPRRSAAKIATFIVAGLVGVIIMYLCGSAGLMVRLGLKAPEALASNGPFIIGDALKVVFAALIASAVTTAVPNLLPQRKG